MTPIVDGLTNDFENELNVYRLDAAQSEVSRYQSELGVRGHPSFVIIDHSNEVTARFLGPQDDDTLRQEILANLESGN